MSSSVKCQRLDEIVFTASYHSDVKPTLKGKSNGRLQARTQDVATPEGRPVPLCHGLWEGKEGEKEGREGSENYFKKRR